MTLGSADKGNQPIRVPYDAIISSLAESVLYSSGSDLSETSDSGSDTDTESKPNTSTRNDTNVNEQSANASPRTFPSHSREANSPLERRTSNTTTRNTSTDVNGQSSNASPRTFSHYREVNSPREGRTPNTTIRNNEQSANASPRTFPSRYQEVVIPNERRKRRKLNSTREDVANLVNDTSSPSIKQENRIPFLIGKLVETVMIKLPPPSAKQFMDRILVLMTEFNGLDEGTFFQ